MKPQIAPADWTAFCEVMGDKGGCGGCWCMLWRRSKKDFEAGKGDGNRSAMQALFDTGHIPGLVARQNGQAIGWIQIDTRPSFPRLATSRILQPVDDTPVWCVSCFFVHKSHRRSGLSLPLLNAACDFAAERGAQMVEGYPIEPPKTPYPAVYAWTGFAATFRAAGFAEVARRSASRPIMRKSVAG